MKKFWVLVILLCWFFLELKKKKVFSWFRFCRLFLCFFSVRLLVRVIDCKNIIYVDDCFMCNKILSKLIVWCFLMCDVGLWLLKCDCDCGLLSVIVIMLSDVLMVIIIYIICISIVWGSVRLYMWIVMYFMYLILLVVS